MFQRYLKTVTLLTLALTTSAGLWAQAPAEPKWKDQAEYDLVQAIGKEPDANKKLQMLNTWKEKYPESDFKLNRLQQYIGVYQGLKNGEKMYEATKDLLAANPKDVTGLYFCTALTLSLQNTAPDRLSYGEKCAQDFLEVLKQQKAPQGMTEEAFAKQKAQSEKEAERTLLYIYTARKDWPKVESYITELLKKNPNSGTLSYQLASALIAQKKVDKQIVALYHLARAAYYSGDDALTDPVKKQVQGFLDRSYNGYHGSKDGLQELIDLAKTSAFPPDGFTIKSEGELMAEQENKIKAEDPVLAAWLFSIKDPLMKDSAYFDSMKGAGLPKLKGRVVSVSPATRPKEILVAMSQAGTEPEVKIRLDAAMPNAAPAGTEIEFEGAVAAEFTKDPAFMLTVDLEKDKLVGWPKPAAPAGRSGSSKKGGASTKK